MRSPQAVCVSSLPTPRHSQKPPMHNLIRISLATLLSLAVAPAGSAQSSTASMSGAQDDPKLELDLEQTSHVVRQDEDRFNVRYRSDKWEFEGLLASLSPRFREDNDQIGALVSRAFDWGQLTAVVRRTNKPAGEDTLAGIAYRSASSAGSFGAELTWGQADLLDNDFLVGDAENQIVGRVFWRRDNGYEIEVFGGTSATFDVMRGASELLERLPRSEIGGAETLADLYVDEGRIEDSAGIAVARHHDRLSWRAYAKSGEQTIRGIFDADDMTGFGGEVSYQAPALQIHAELDLRRIDLADGFDSFERGRFFFDVGHRTGNVDWGVGGYIQGEAETFSEIPDVYDTAGIGFSASLTRKSGRRLGLWAMWEDNAPELEVITRLGFFTESGERKYGVGVRREAIGSRRFEDETFGPFVFFGVPFRDLMIHGDLGVQDGDAYGTLSLGFKR